MSATGRLEGRFTSARAAMEPDVDPVGAGPQSDPTELLQLAEGMHAVEVIVLAVAWLGVFERLADYGREPVTLARDLNLAERPTRVMLTLLQSLKLLDRDASDRYVLTPLAREYLLPESPWNIIPVFAALKDRPSCREMLAVMRTGDPVGFTAGGAADWTSRMDDESFAEFFLGGTDSRNAYLAHAVAAQLDQRSFQRLLDVGGGSGIYSCALALRNPDLSGTVFEKAPVDAIARRAIARRGLADRIDVVAGDMFDDDLPSGYDVHLYSNVLHDWDEKQAQRLIASSFAALEAGGQIVIHDALLNADGAGPFSVAAYSVLLMMFTAGRCYSVSEVRTLLTQAGFRKIKHAATVVQRDLITAVKPR